MAGKLTPWAGAAMLLVAALSPAGAQAPADPKAPPATPSARRPAWFGGGERHRPAGTPEEMEKFKNVRKALDELTPEQRQRFQENFLRWSNLSPEEKKALLAGDVVTLHNMGVNDFLMGYLARFGACGLNVPLYAERIRSVPH